MTFNLDFCIQLISPAGFQEDNIRPFGMMFYLEMRTFVFGRFEDFSIWRESHMSPSHHVIITSGSSTSMTCIDGNIHYSILSYP